MARFHTNLDWLGQWAPVQMRSQKRYSKIVRCGNSMILKQRTEEQWHRIDARYGERGVDTREEVVPSLY